MKHGCRSPEIFAKSETKKDVFKVQEHTWQPNHTQRACTRSRPVSLKFAKEPIMLWSTQQSWILLFSRYTCNQSRAKMGYTNVTYFTLQICKSCDRNGCLFVCLFASSLTWDAQSETIQVASILPWGSYYSYACGKCLASQPDCLNI